MKPDNPADMVRELAGMLRLAPRVFEMQRSISLGTGREAIGMVSRPAAAARGDWTPEEIERMVNRLVRLGAAAGLLNTCLTRSAIRCAIMRENGIDARLVFGLRRPGETLSGHCWVTWPGGPDTSPSAASFAVIESYPS
ncbi:MAG TPA: lasso peptide biosynthesis B2 protein [bacterium]|nr:lasso peptide biosynthesis B2 protein [bacterium]